MYEQISLFDVLGDFTIDKKIRLIEFFAGYGSQNLALKYLGVDYEHYKICEWAVKSIQAYKDLHCYNDNTDYSKDLSYEYIIDYLTAKGISANYNEPMTKDQIKRMGETKCRKIYNNIIATNNLVSICNTKAKDLEITETDKYCYIMTYSFPCQDLSLAGKQKGMEKGSGTRSGLLWEVERILKECTELPQVLVMENVPQVHGKKAIDDFVNWQAFLRKLGYTNYWKDLNAKDYGIPQNRNRCFMVSILGQSNYKFPTAQKLNLRLKDMLEDKVDEKYYLSDKIKNYFIQHSKDCEEKGSGFRFSPQDGSNIAKCVTTRAGDRMDDNFIKEPTKIDDKYYLSNKMKEYIIADNKKWTGNNDKSVINKEIASTINTGEGHRRCDASNYICKELPENYNLKETLCNKLIEEGLVEEGDVIRHSYTNNRLDNGIKNMKRTESKEKLSPTLDTRCDCLGVVVKDKIACELRTDEGIRTFNNNLMGTLRTTNCCGDKHIIEKPVLAGGIGEKKSNKGTQYYQQNRIYDADAIAMCHPANIPGGSYHYLVEEEPKILQRPHGFNKGKVLNECPSITTSAWQENNVLLKSNNKRLKNLVDKAELKDETLYLDTYNQKTNKIAGTITTGVDFRNSSFLYNDLRIRKLTPKECFRLMGVKDEDFERVAKNQSNASLYHLAGDSIVVNVLMAIFSQML